jgi:serine protease Do
MFKENRPLSRSYRFLPLIALLFSFSILFQSLPLQAAEKARPAIDLSTAIIQVAKKNIPAVVHIEVTARQEVTAPTLPFENDPFFRYFFGIPNRPKKFKKESKGLGTGMIIDAQGYILTNYHVAGGASKIDVLLADGNKYPAKLIGSDPKTDLAVIKISAKESLPCITFGNSDKTEVGEWVVAIGHPRGLDQTVTQGIISAKHRTGITDPSSYQDFLQTDAAINPGNSGGPLLNLQGEVVGVNTIIVSGSGGFEGIGLAIPSNIATHVAKTIIAKGKVDRGWLGISMQDVTSEQAKTYGFAGPTGAIVADVMAGGPADKAGIKKGDVITSIEGKTVSNASMLRNQVAISPIGGDVKLTILRAGKKQDIIVRVTNAQEAIKQVATSVKERFGAEVRALTPKETARFGLEENQGVAIKSVEPKGPLGKVGFEVGDLILEVNGQNVAGPQGLAELVGNLKPQQRLTLLAVDQKSGKSGYIQIITR